MSIANCAPGHNGSPSAMTSKRPPSSPLNSPRSKSRTNWFVDTRASASLHTCAAATSRANPLLPKTPAPEHAARWWPRISSWRPHRHVREETVIESRRRQHNKRRNCWGSIFVTLLVGRAVKTAEINGPCCDLNMSNMSAPAPSSVRGVVWRFSAATQVWVGLAPAPTLLEVVCQPALTTAGPQNQLRPTNAGTSSLTGSTGLLHGQSPPSSRWQLWGGVL